jgi:hypothetical protein
LKVKKNIKKFKEHVIHSQKQNFHLKIYVPQDSFVNRMRDWGMIDKNVNKPVANTYVFKYHDVNIINHYKSKAVGVLEYYKPANNFHWLKKQIDYHMRYSLLFTLARKHRKSVSKIIGLIGRNASIYVQTSDDKLKKIASFLISSEIQGYKKGFTRLFDPMKKFKKLNSSFVRLSIPKVLYKECQIKGCNNTDIEIYNVKALDKKISRNSATSFVKSGNKKLYSIKAFECTVSKKQVLLCKAHFFDVDAGRLTHIDIKNNSTLLKLLNKNKTEIK